MPGVTYVTGLCVTHLTGSYHLEIVPTQRQIAPLPGAVVVARTVVGGRWPGKTFGAVQARRLLQARKARTPAGPERLLRTAAADRALDKKHRDSSDRSH